MRIMNRHIGLFCLAVVFFGGCQSSKETLSTVTCIKLEHVGASDGKHYTLIMSNHDTLCGMKVEHPTDKVWIKRVTMTDEIFSSVTEIIYNLSFAQEPKSGMYAGYTVSLMSDTGSIKEGYIGSYTEFETLLGSLKKEIKDKKVVNQLNEVSGFFSEYDFY